MKSKNMLAIIMVICIFLMFFTNAENIKSALKDSLLFTVNNVICSIFPYMVLSSFLINANIIEKQLKFSNFERLNKLGICKIYFISILLGSVSGFLTGAKCIKESYTKNITDSVSFSNAVILSSNAGIGFVVVCVGMKIWNSAVYGILLYIFQLITSLLLGRLLLPIVKNDYEINHSRKVDYIKSFTDAVSSGAQSVVLITAFIASFSIVITLLSSLAPHAIRETVSAILYIILEFCKGSFESISFSNLLMCAFFSGFTIGFGGLCVHFQIFSICNDLPLNKKLFILFKIFHGIILGLISVILIHFLNLSPSISASVNSSSSLLNKISIFVLVFIIIYTLYKKFLLT
jgi:hypothetical protein